MNASKLSSRQAGLTLIELMIAIAISAIILAGVLFFASQARNGNRVNTAISDTSSMVGKTLALYNDSPNGFSNVTAEALIQGGAVPSDMLTDGAQSTAIRGPFGGSVTVAPASYNGGNNNAITFTFPGVPSGECAGLVAGVQSNFSEVTAGSTTVKDIATGQAYSPTGAGQGCSSSPGTAAVVLTAVL